DATACGRSSRKLRRSATATAIPEQGRWLRQVVTGFFACHAVPTNIWSLGTRIIDLWRRSLRRRSQKDGTTWRRITKVANDFLPRARILHPWPQERFAVKYPRWEPRMGPRSVLCGGRSVMSVPTAIGGRSPVSGTSPPLQNLQASPDPSSRQRDLGRLG